MDSTDRLCAPRRAVLRGLAGAVLLPGTLVACSSGADDAASGQEDVAAAGGQSDGSGTVPVSEVPVGTARVVDVGGVPVVVGQPADGRFVAYSAACTHQGTVVQAGEGLTAVCPAHGSEFDVTDGSVDKGPATEPLRSLPVALDGDSVRIG